MLRKTLIVAGVALMITAGVPALAGECPGCVKVAKGDDGFCCTKGKAFGVDITSKRLHTALAGYEVDAKKINCSGCKTAIKTSGQCEQCNVLAADGKVYRSPVAHALAKGMFMPASLVQACPERCKQCPIAHRENGSCKSCGVGFVANRMFEDTGAYKTALAAFDTLKKAVKACSFCDECAVAMVTDGSCDKCKVAFKDGQRVTDAG